MAKYYLPHATKDEKVIMLLRRHWLVLGLKLFMWVIVGSLPVAFYLFDPEVFGKALANEVLQTIFLLLLSVFYLYVWIFIFHSFVDYYLDTWIVTDRRIINIEQKGLFAREASEQKLFRIQDVTSELKGILPTFLNFGTVYVQTAAEEPRFTFKQIPNPTEVAQTIIKLVEKNKRDFHLLEEESKILKRET